jgi:hypothetical protein
MTATYPTYPPVQPPRKNHTKLALIVVIGPAMFALSVLVIVRAPWLAHADQPTQPPQPTASSAYQAGYDSVLNLVARQGPRAYQCPSGAYCHSFIRIANYGPYTVSRWCDESAPYPSANQFPGYSSQLRDFEAGCSAAVYYEAALESTS